MQYAVWNRVQGEGNVFVEKVGRGLQGLYLKIVRKLDSLKGTPQKIANGFATGVAMSFTPFVGFHLLLSLAVARLARQNGIAAALGTYSGKSVDVSSDLVYNAHTGLFMLGADARSCL